MNIRHFCRVANFTCLDDILGFRSRGDVRAGYGPGLLEQVSSEGALSPRIKISCHIRSTLPLKETNALKRSYDGSSARKYIHS